MDPLNLIRVLCISCGKLVCITSCCTPRGISDQIVHSVLFLPQWTTRVSTASTDSSKTDADGLWSDEGSIIERSRAIFVRNNWHVDNMKVVWWNANCGVDQSPSGDCCHSGENSVLRRESDGFDCTRFKNYSFIKCNDGIVKVYDWFLDELWVLFPSFDTHPLLKSRPLKSFKGNSGIVRSDSELAVACRHDMSW